MSHRIAAAHRILPLAGLLIALALVGTGCIKQKIIVKVRPDGTGQLLLSTIYSKEMVAMHESQMKAARQMMAQGGSGHSTTNNPYYNPRVLRYMGRLFGPGVSLVNSRNYDKNGARGFLALYEFKDINDIHISPQMSMASMAMGSAAMVSPDVDEEEMDEQMENMMDSMDEGDGIPVQFKLTQGERNRLEVVLPAMAPPMDIREEDPEKESTSQDSDASMAAAQMMAGGNPFGFTGQETESQMMQKMLRGMVLSLDVEVLDKAAATKDAAPRPGKANRWIVYDVDFGELVGSTRGIQAMEMIQGGMHANGMDVAGFGSFAGLPGASVQTNSFTITF